MPFYSRHCGWANTRCTNRRKTFNAKCDVPNHGTASGFAMKKNQQHDAEWGYHLTRHFNSFFTFMSIFISFFSSSFHGLDSWATGLILRDNKIKQAQSLLSTPQLGSAWFSSFLSRDISVNPVDWSKCELLGGDRRACHQQLVVLWSVRKHIANTCWRDWLKA